jgi:hypothetical protein
VSSGPLASSSAGTSSAFEPARTVDRIVADVGLGDVDAGIQLASRLVVAVVGAFERRDQVRKIGRFDRVVLRARRHGLGLVALGHRGRLVGEREHSRAIAPRVLDGKAWMAGLLGDDLVTIRVRVPEREVVFVKGVLEASEGLAAVLVLPRPPGDSSHDGGALVIAAPRSRATELYEAVADLRAEALVWDEDVGNVAGET